MPFCIPGLQKKCEMIFSGQGATPRDLAISRSVFDASDKEIRGNRHDHVKYLLGIEVFTRDLQITVYRHRGGGGNKRLKIDGQWVVGKIIRFGKVADHEIDKHFIIVKRAASYCHYYGSTFHLPFFYL
jgi:hypothetical protein